MKRHKRKGRFIQKPLGSSCGIGKVPGVACFCFFPVVILQVNLKLQKILVSFSERLKQGFIKGRIIYKSVRWGNVYYSKEPVGVCMLSKMVFWNNDRKGYCIIRK